MGWISRLRGAHYANNLIREAENEIAILRPFRDLHIGIFSASWQSAEEFREFLSKLPLTKYGTIPEEKRYYIFLEFLFFFLHFTSRQAYGRLPQARANSLLQTIGESLLSSAIDVFIGHWPKKHKTQIQSELYDNLNQSEGEYATCKQLSEPTLPSGFVRTRLADSAQLSHLAFHVLRYLRPEIDATRIDTETALLAQILESVVMSKLIDGKGAPNSDLVPISYGTLDALGRRVDRANAAVEDYEHDGRSLLEGLREAREVMSKEIAAVAKSAVLPV